MIIDHKEELSMKLQQKGYLINEIHQAFTKINEFYYKRNEGKGKITSQKFIKQTLTTKSEYTYILMETLSNLLLKWEAGQIGKILQKNMEVYKLECKKLYIQAVNLCGE